MSKTNIKEFAINHLSRKDPALPVYQQLLFGDGHVEGKAGSYYSMSISEDDYLTTFGQWSFACGGTDWGPWFYWEGTGR